MSAWKVNGTELGTADTTVLVMPNPRVRTGERLHAQGVPEGEKRFDHAGQDKPQLQLRFRITGSKPDIYQEVGHIQGEVEKGTVWTLEEPSDVDVRLWRDKDRIALLTASTRQLARDGINHVDVVITAKVLGEWQADGGDYVEEMEGHFTQQSDGSFTDEEGSNWSGGPIVEVPQQEEGHPLAVRRSDLQQAEPPWMETITTTDRDGDVTRRERYDLTGFHLPEMTQTDDVAQFELKSSPAVEYLSGLSALDTEPLQTEAGKDLQIEAGETLQSQGTA
jgi:hypothetical protein